MRSSRALITVLAALSLVLGVFLVASCVGEDEPTAEEVFQRFDEAYFARDMEVMESLIASDVTYSYQGVPVGQGEFSLAGEEDLIENIVGKWAGGDAEDAVRVGVEVVEVTDDTVTISTEWTGVESQVFETEVYTIGDGQITDWRIVCEEVVEVVTAEDLAGIPSRKSQWMNLRLWQEFYEADEARDIDTIETLLASDVSFSFGSYDAREFSWDVSLEGEEGVIAVIESFWETQDSQDAVRRVEVTGFSDDTITVSSEWTLDANEPVEPSPYGFEPTSTISHTEIFTCRDGEIIDWKLVQSDFWPWGPFGIPDSA